MAEESLPATSLPAQIPGGAPAVSQHHGRLSYKSWRKKYYKMRHDFHKQMIANQAQFEEEQRMLRLARRLQEQNDQLMDLLLEVNQSTRLPPHLRFNIRSPTPSESAVPALTDDLDDDDAPNSAVEPQYSLAQLSAVPHSSIADLPSDPEELREVERFVNDEQTGYLSPEHEEDYLLTLDSLVEIRNGYNGISSEDPQQQQQHRPPSPPPGPYSNRDAGTSGAATAALKNPVSVYNWLRRNQPNVFLDHGGGADDKVSAGADKVTTSKEERAASKAAPTKVMPKRASVGYAVVKHEEEILADDGTVISGGLADVGYGSVRGKRKAQDDDAYRPKGGSSRSKKKKVGSLEKMDLEPRSEG